MNIMNTKANSKKKSVRRSTGKTGVFYSRLSPAELDRMAEPFDQEFVPTRPLTATMHKQDRRAKRKRGRPVIGEGSEKVLVTLEKALLRDADNFAQRVGRNRSHLIADGLRAIIYSADIPPRPRTPKAA
jgi:hypothetical protein